MWKWTHDIPHKNTIRCNRSVGIVTGLLAGWSRVWFLVGPRHFSLLQNVQTSHGVHTATYTMGTVGSFPCLQQLVHKADTHVHVVPSLAMSDTTPTLPHTLTACTGTVFVSSYKMGITSRILHLVNSFHRKKLGNCVPILQLQFIKTINYSHCHFNSTGWNCLWWPTSALNTFLLKVCVKPSKSTFITET
jgi:hypothetical protein